jgi:hypothetical protein
MMRFRLFIAWMLTLCAMVVVYAAQVPPLPEGARQVIDEQFAGNKARSHRGFTHFHIRADISDFYLSQPARRGYIGISRSLDE